MKKLLISGFVLLSLQGLCQQQDTKTMQENARSFVSKGDYNNAVLVLNRAVEQDPENTQVAKDLAFALYLKTDLNKAEETIKPLLDKRDADVTVYQVAGLIYKAKEELNEAEKLYKKGTRKFPESGVLYNDYGELLWFKRDNNSIKQWEKGMEVDPNYSANYYNAAKYYYYTADKTWSIIYAEIFVNMESYSRRTIELKYLLLESYKKLLTDTDIMKDQNSKNPFQTAYLTTISRTAPVISMGISPESLTILRTRFILDWDDKYASRFPFRLFEYHRQLLKAGLFEAYNQWLFGPIQNLTAFQNWTNKHTEAYTEFTSFQQGRVFKLPQGQNYQSMQNKKD
jgi:tetratricopeptide (TPR) repeat protein